MKKSLSSKHWATAFLANMAHEIRSPMTTILGFSSLLQSSALNEKQKKQIDTLASSADHLLELIDQILDYAKVKSGRINPEPVDFNLEELIGDVLKTVSPHVEGKPVILKNNIAPDTPLFIHADAARLKQILLFLLNHAVTFTAKGEIIISVRALKKGQLFFSVKDTGMGIPREYQPVVFEIFSQTDRAVIRKFGDSALGLMLAKEYVTLMGGEIKVESRPGKGSTFSFTIKHQSGESLWMPGSVGKTKQDPCYGADKARCQEINILVVEDNPPNRVLLKTHFKALNCHGDYVGSGEDAVKKLKDKDYQLCLMDIHMPGMDGFETTKIIRNDLKMDLPIIGLTADATRTDEEECRAAGMNGCLKKPLLLTHLKDVIIKWAKCLQGR